MSCLSFLAIHLYLVLYTCIHCFRGYLNIFSVVGSGNNDSEHVYKSILKTKRGWYCSVTIPLPCSKFTYVSLDFTLRIKVPVSELGSPLWYFNSFQLFLFFPHIYISSSGETMFPSFLLTLLICDPHLCIFIFILILYGQLFFNSLSAT